MLLDSIGVPILTSLISSLIYDTIKKALSILGFNTKKNALSYQKKAKGWVQHLSPEFDILVENRKFHEYIEAPQVQDIIRNFIVYTITGRRDELVKLKEDILESKKNVIKYLVDTILDNDKSLYSSQRIIYEFFYKLFDFIEDIFWSTLSPDEKGMIYFINSRLAHYSDKIIAKLLEDVNSMKNIAFQQKEQEFIYTKEEYTNILIERNSKAHIYLLDTFSFNSFYISPKLGISKENLDSNFIFNSLIESDFALNSRHFIPNIITQQQSFEAVQFDIFNNETKSETGYTDWKFIFDKNNIIYVTGGAGYGKSLFLRNIIINFDKLNIPCAKDHLVIFGDLKTFYNTNSNSPKSMLEFLQDSMKISTLMDTNQISQEMIQYYLNLGRCIILLDALDEVDKDKRAELHSSIIAFFKKSNPNNKICLTSRNRGFFPSKDIETLTIQPLDEYQIELYVDRIIALKKFDKSNKESFLEQTKVLIKKGFLNSFLVLSLLINIYKAELELPENKLELYEKCFEYIANRREKEKSSTKYDWDRISPLMKDNTFIELACLGLPNNNDISKDSILEKLLRVYCKKFDSEVETENSINEFLRFCGERTELFVPSNSEDSYKFFHRSFFEYFYSQFIFYRCQSSTEIVEKMMQFDVDSEVFELTIAMLKQKSEEKYQSVLLNILSQTERFLSGESKLVLPINIAIIVLQVVDDRFYERDFLYLLTKHAKKIYQNVQKLVNTIYLERLLKNNLESMDELCKVYFPYAIIDFLYGFHDKLNIINKIYNHEKPERRTAYSLTIYSQLHFYTHIVLNSDDYREKFFDLIFSTTSDFLDWYRTQDLDKRKIPKVSRYITEILKDANKKMLRFELSELANIWNKHY